MNTTEILSLLAGVKKSVNGWEARCPVHEDAKASLSVTTGTDGRVLILCHAGCKTEDIVAKLGLKMSSLFPARQPTDSNRRTSRMVANYDYTDEGGNLLFQCVRYDPKNFRQRRPDPEKSGQWIWNLNGVRRVLYRLAEVKTAMVTGGTIFVAEGEKDCDRLAKEGFVATCNPMGADKRGSKWLPEHTEILRGASRVVVIADKDKPGVNTQKQWQTHSTTSLKA